MRSVVDEVARDVEVVGSMVVKDERAILNASNTRFGSPQVKAKMLFPSLAENEANIHPSPSAESRW